jgi:WD40 repeat protein
MDPSVSVLDEALQKLRPVDGDAAVLSAALSRPVSSQRGNAALGSRSGSRGRKKQTEGDGNFASGPSSADLMKLYNDLRSERDQAMLAMMMRMGLPQLSLIRQEFFEREDSVSLEEFIYIMTYHLVHSGARSFVDDAGRDREARKFGSMMFDLFKEVDVNGDGGMEWDEFCKFLLDKASHLNKEMKLNGIRNYYDNSSTLDLGIKMRRRNDIAHMCNIDSLGHFALCEEKRKSIWIYNSRSGENVTNVQLNALPLAVEHIPEQELLVAACADMTLVSMGLGNPSRRYSIQSVVPTSGVQMSIASLPSKHLVYTGSDRGNIYAWNMNNRNVVHNWSAHSDMVMNILALKKLDNLLTASLDSTIALWDAYTTDMISRLKGHKNGVFSMAYNADSRLLVSCGFDHDAFVWSPFVNSLVYKLKGHTASLIGCQAIESSPEIVTADANGVFKLWDIRTFQCVQTFSKSQTSKRDDQESLCCFFLAQLPSVNKHQTEDDFRIVAASKMVYVFDQKRVVHERTADFTSVLWLSYNEAASTIITTSVNNLTVWDALLGSKKASNINMCEYDMTAFCLDDRKRKIIVGTSIGKIMVYNPSNGAYMKSTYDDPDTIDSAVVGLSYIDDKRWLIGGFSNGIMKLYDENRLDDIVVIRVFDRNYRNREVSCMSINLEERIVASAGGVAEPIKFWDIDNCKMELSVEVFAPESTESVVRVECLYPLPLIASADSTGRIIIWGSVGYKTPGAMIARFMNQTPNEAKYEPVRDGDLSLKPHRRILLPSDDDEPDEEELFSRKFGIKQQQDVHPGGNKYGPPSAAVSLVWGPKEQCLYTGDEQGYLRKWSLQGVIESLSIDRVGKANRSRSFHEDPNDGSMYTRGANSTEVNPANIVQRNSILVTQARVNYVWAFPAHDEAILFTSWCTNGIFTTSTDREVRMWTIDGMPIGSLYHSIPQGVMSDSWSLKLDVSTLMDAENKELDGIMEEVNKVAANPDKPEIDKNNLPSMIPSMEAAKYSETSFRNVIERSTKMLGIEVTRGVEEGDQASMDSKSSQSAVSEIRSRFDPEKDTRILGVSEKKRHTTRLQKLATQFGQTTENGSKLPYIKITEKPTDMSTYQNEDDSAGSVSSKSTIQSKSNKLFRRLSSFGAGQVTEKQRNRAIDKTCKKYSTFKALDHAIHSSRHSSIDPEHLVKIREKRNTTMCLLGSVGGLPKVTDGTSSLGKDTGPQRIGDIPGHLFESAVDLTNPSNSSFVEPLE